jgi:hypothetical protein
MTNERKIRFESGKLRLAHPYYRRQQEAAVAGRVNSVNWEEYMHTPLACQIIVISTILLLGCHNHAPLTQTRVPPPPAMSGESKGAPVEVGPVVLPDCPGVAPICAGGLISQHAAPDQINTYMATYKLTAPLSCRFQQPPRCVTAHRPKCAQECMP